MMLVYVFSLNVMSEHSSDIGQLYRSMRNSEIYVDTFNFLIAQPNELLQ